MPKNEKLQPDASVPEIATRVTLEISLRPALNIDDLTALREVAAQRGQSVEQVVIEALRGVLAAEAA